MRARDLRLSPSLAAALLLCAASVPASSQQDRSGERTLRTAWGAPDLQGTWDFRTLTPLVRPPELAGKAVLTPDEAQVFRDQTLELLDVDKRAGEASLDVEFAYNSVWWDWGTELDQDLRTSLIVDPANGMLPKITPEALARMDEQNRLRTPPVRDLFSYSANPAVFRPEGPESIGLSERCLVGFNAGPPLTPSAYNNNLRIVQTEDHVLLVTEMIHDARVVPLHARSHLPPEMKRWSGDSIGRWEGDSLVVETTNFSDKTPTFQLPTTIATATESGAVGSAANMHLTERFTPAGKGRLLYEYTIEDPSTFTHPFTVEFSMRAANSPMFEYACHEGNYSMPSMLKGARLLEQEASDGAAESEGR